MATASMSSGSMSSGSGRGWRGARRTVLAVSGVVLGLVLTAAPAQAAPGVTVLGDTLLDPSGVYFVSFDGLVNNQSYQQSAILSHAGFQYAAWYRSNRNAVLARRALPSGGWQTVQLPHRLSTNDSHNVISLGVSPADGRLHVAMDTHDSRVFYVRSVAGLASAPGSHGWTLAEFGAEQRTLDGLELGSITYPQFAVTPQNRLQLSYRTGSSGNGVNNIAEYANGAWAGLGAWTSATGSYSANGATSTTRNMYLHGFAYAGSRLHATFTWREGNSAVLCDPGGLANHDTGYVFSDDAGRSWRNDAGAVVAATGGSQRVGVGSPGTVVDPLSVDHALMNQESQAVDHTGRIHAVVSYVPGRFTQCVSGSYAAQRTAFGRAFHVYRDAAGWHKTEIPVPLNATGRSQLVFDAADNAYVVLPFGRIVTASKASNWTDWTVRFDGAGRNAFGEVLVDRSRVAAGGVLSILYQQRSTGSTPSAVRVLDVRLG
jgi:hypothetical protein